MVLEKLYNLKEKLLLLEASAIDKLRTLKQQGNRIDNYVKVPQ